MNEVVRLLPRLRQIFRPHPRIQSITNLARVDCVSLGRADAFVCVTKLIKRLRASPFSTRGSKKYGFGDAGDNCIEKTRFVLAHHLAVFVSSGQLLLFKNIFAINLKQNAARSD